MNRNRMILLLGVVAMALLALPAAFAAQGDLWFDLENCSMCKHMTAEDDLMEHMEWDNHLTANGMMSVTVVAHGYEKAFAKAMKKMEATGGKLMTGEQMYLCGFCQSYGELVMAGAKMEHFETVGGIVNLVSSQDPAVVKKIHAHGQRTIDEHKKMMAVMDHKGHGHDDHSNHSKGDH